MESGGRRIVRAVKNPFFMPEISRILEFVGPCGLIFVARGGVLYYNDLYILIC